MVLFQLFFKLLVNGKTEAGSKPKIRPETFFDVRIYASKPSRRGDYARAQIRNFRIQSVGDDAIIGVHVDNTFNNNPASIGVMQLPEDWRRKNRQQII